MKRNGRSSESHQARLNGRVAPDEGKAKSDHKDSRPPPDYFPAMGKPERTPSSAGFPKLDKPERTPLADFPKLDKPERIPLADFPKLDKPERTPSADFPKLDKRFFNILYNL